MRKRLGITVLALLGCQAEPGPLPPDSTPLTPRGSSEQETVDRILAESLARGRAHALLGELCEVAPHRLSGSEGAQLAVEWARDRMIALGFENVRLEPCTVPRWERGRPEELRFVGAEGYRSEGLPVLALGGSVPTPQQGVTAEVIAVDSFEELVERAAEAVGRIVLFNRPMDDTLPNTFQAYGGAVGQRGGGAVAAAKVGAVAALVRSMTTRRDDNPHTGAMRYDPDVTRIPTAAISTNAADHIARLLRAGEVVRMELKLDCRSLAPVESFNVVGEIVGRELPDEVVVIGGHLDAWDVGQGAHDDGAGCIQAMEVLRLVHELDIRPRRTLRCVLFMNEENGLAGGRAYYVEHFAEMDRHVMALESDRGGFTPRGFTAQVSDEALVILRSYVTLFANTGADKVIAGGGGADIGPMRQSAVPLVGYLPDPQRYFDLHHSPADTIDQVNPRELQLGAAAMASLAWLVAEDPTPLPRISSEDE